MEGSNEYGDCIEEGVAQVSFTGATLYLSNSISVHGVSMRV